MSYKLMSVSTKHPGYGLFITTVSQPVGYHVHCEAVILQLSLIVRVMSTWLICVDAYSLLQSRVLQQHRFWWRMWSAT